MDHYVTDSLLFVDCLDHGEEHLAIQDLRKPARGEYNPYKWKVLWLRYSHLIQAPESRLSFQHALTAAGVMDAAVDAVLEAGQDKDALDPFVRHTNNTDVMTTQLVSVSPV